MSRFKNVLFAALSILVIGCGESEESPPSVVLADTVHAGSQSIAAEDDNGVQEPAVKPVKYELLREPNGGSGVFDFMYIVYVAKPISNEEAKWIFSDLRKKNGEKIAIDVWSSKQAFNEVLKVYQKEDAIFDAGGDLKAFAKVRDRVTNKYDKYNIAQYSNNGVETTMKLPEGNTD